LTARAYSIAEAADRLSISQKTLRRMAQDNRIKVLKISARRLVVPESEISRLLDPQREAAQ
jgi:excisionase family DNA binding protein